MFLCPQDSSESRRNKAIMEWILGYVPVFNRSLYFSRSWQYCSMQNAARSYFFSLMSFSAVSRKSSALSLRSSASG